MKTGDIIEFAVWLTGQETMEDLISISEDMKQVRESWAKKHNLIFDSGTAVTRYPGDDRVPAVPSHISGPAVRLLIVEARILMFNPDRSVSRFVDDLEPDDLNRLRKISRDAYAKLYSKRPFLTDAQCNTVINDLGPDAAADALRGHGPNVISLMN